MSAIYKLLSGSQKGKEKREKHLNRQRLLVVSSRGVTYRHRHLINDLHALLPHLRKEPKIDTKKNLYVLNEIAELNNCNNIVFFEARKHMDLYMWLSKPPNGPTIKFHLQNLHTMDELNFTGNCLKGSRPVLSFDSAFDEQPQYRLIKELLLQVFGVPPLARKSKPFVDHVYTFSILDGKIWFRNYQINETEDLKESEDAEIESSKVKDLSLVEIGPRFVMTPITILEGSFGGPKIYENKEYVSPNFVRSQIKQQLAVELKRRSDELASLKLKRRDQVLEADPLDNSVLFKD